MVDVGAAGQDVLAFEIDVQRALRVGRAVQPEIDAADLHRARHFQAACLAIESGIDFRPAVVGAGERAFGVEQPFEAETELGEIGRVDVQAQHAAAAAEAAFGVDQVAAQPYRQIGTAQIALFVRDFAAAAEIGAGKLRRGELQVAVENLVGDSAVEFDAAVDVAGRPGGIDFGWVETLAAQLRLQGMFFKQRQAA